MGWKKFSIVAGVLISVFTLIGVQNCWAIPAWSRKYGTDCSTCHRPNVPRLNVEGHTFRKLGFRFPDEIGKKPNYKEIGEYLSMRIRFRYEHQDADDADTRSRFNLNDATFFYAGPVTENLTGFVEMEWADTDEIELNAYMSWLFGTADRYLSVRGGQMHTLARVGWAGFDRPSGISTTGVLGGDLTDSPVPFAISQDQQGVELAFGPNRDARVIAQALNGINFEGSGNEGSDDDTDKDILLAYEHILDKNGSGFTLFGYRGVWHQDPVDLGLTPETVQDDDNQFDFYRYGATASILFDIFPAGLSEILGGAMFSRDNIPDNHPINRDNIKGQAYFAELEQYFSNASVFARADFIDPDTQDHDWRNRYTVGAAHMVNNNLRLALELFVQDIEDQHNPYGGVAEAMINF